MKLEAGCFCQQKFSIGDISWHAWSNNFPLSTNNVHVSKTSWLTYITHVANIYPLMWGPHWSSWILLIILFASRASRHLSNSPSCDLLYKVSPFKNGRLVFLVFSYPLNWLNRENFHPSATSWYHGTTDCHLALLQYYGNMLTSLYFQLN